MDQDDLMDFNALRAKFQDEDILLKQPRTKPALPQKPKVIPPPQSPTANSPTQYLPAGARPSLLTSMYHTLDAKSSGGPTVVFKEDKKESKKPLIPKKGESKSKGGKDKATKGRDKANGEGKADAKDKKPPPLPGTASKVRTGELVPAATPPPPKVAAAAPKKKGFLGFRKSSKKEAPGVPADSLLDAPSPDVPGLGPVLLMSPSPAPQGQTEPGPPRDPEPLQIRKALTPPVPTIPDYSAVAVADYSAIAVADAAALPSPVKRPVVRPTITPPPPPPPPPTPAAVVPDVPAAPEDPVQEPEPPAEIETSAMSVPVFSPPPPPPDSVTPTPPAPEPTTPPPSPAEVDVPYLPPPPVVPVSPSPPPPPPPPAETDAGVAPAAAAEVEPAEAGEAEAEEEEEEEEEEPLLPVVEPPPPPPPTPPSPQAEERPVSALSALERAGEMSPAPGKKTPPCDQRILQALEKARRKFSPVTSTAVSPTPEEPPMSVSPTCSLYELPPIDYDDQNRPVEVNGFDHRQASPLLEGIAEEGTDFLPDLMMVPPLPPRQPLPDLDSLGPAPEKPARPPGVDLTPYLPPPALEDNTIDIPAPPEFFSEGEVSAEVQEFEDVGSDAPGLPSPESPELESWGNGVSDSLDSPEGHTFPETDTSEFHGNGTEYDGEFQDVPESTQEAPESSSSPVAQDIPMITGLLTENSYRVYESGDNVYEDVATAATKKKGKGDGGKKRKGPPKNPYIDSQPSKAEEKTKMGRFGRTDKKAAPPEGPDEKELRKREKQRLEKEKKELKEQKEREKKEQKEREKKEGEMKKKFKITGQEEAMYQATVTVTTKGRKNDLQAKSGDLITIIRTTNCPKGKWLARDGTNTYGYIAVDHLELDIKEMLELGKRAGNNRRTSTIAIEPEAASQGSRTSNQYPLSTGSFTDDSEEWSGDDEEVISSPTETSDPFSPAAGHTRTHSMPDMGNKDVSIIHQHSHSDISTEGPQARHEALQKLATFFHGPKPVEEEPTPVEEEPTPSHSTEEEAGPVFVEEETLCLPDDSCSTEEVDADLDLDPDMIILPPPDLYADITTFE